MQDNLGRIQATGAQLIAISSDAADDAGALKEKLGLAFPLVSDGDLSVAAAFGVRQVGKDSPLPSTFVLDGDRKVTWARVGADIATRVSIDETLQHVR